MAKRKEEEPPKGAPAWQSTFADLMNLLLCFFVLLFSMSTVDAEKLQAVAASFSQTFSVFQAGATAIGDGILISNGVSQLNELDKYINSTGKAQESEVESEDFMKEFEQASMNESEMLAETVSEALDESEYEGDIDNDFTTQYVSLTLNGAFLFDSGKAEIKEEAKPVLDKVGQILTRYASSTIEIEGHTDNVPISNSKFPNNDVLSSYRALAVFDYFRETTAIDPATMKHSGRGDYVPVADNATAEGRAKNRRVEIKIYTSLSDY